MNLPITDGSVRIDKISAGENHTCLLDSRTSSLFVCGETRQGQLGLGQRHLPIGQPLKFDGMRHEFIVDVACGQNHTLMVTNLGYVYSTGCNLEGQLGLGNKAS